MTVSFCAITGRFNHLAPVTILSLGQSTCRRVNHSGGGFTPSQQPMRPNRQAQHRWSKIMSLTLETAQTIAAATLAAGAEKNLKPLTVAVLDAGGHLKVLLRQDGTSTLRPEIALGKARGAVHLGIGSRAIFNRAQEQPYFVQSVNALADGALVPVPGGVLILGEGGAILGAVGVTGDTSDNDEACAVTAIEAVGLTAKVD